MLVCVSPACDDLVPVAHRETVPLRRSRERLTTTPDDDRTKATDGSLGFLQENLRRSGPTASIGYVLIGAIGVCGGGGYALDRWLGTEPWFLFGGLLLGIVVGFYELAKIVWPR